MTRAPESGPVYAIESVDRALELILALQDVDSLRVTDASDRLGVSRSTAYRLLTVLEHREFVTQDKQTKRFSGGPALLRVGLAVVARSDIRAEMHPVLESVVADLQETAHLVVLQGREAFFLDCVEAPAMIRATSRVGTSLPAHCTSGGKVLLAELPSVRLDDLLAAPLDRMTKRSKVTATGVRRELARVRRRGWATNDGESEPGLRAVAVLVPADTTRAGTAVAIAVAAPADRLGSEDMARVANVVSAAIGNHRRAEAT
ncbi:MAG: IclR family transcriptional regulator [Actinomycetota bacterium]|nr:IclR family transcriptional regulator [Actinomycetota bacterium]